jgi:hypothetical protein
MEIIYDNNIIYHIQTCFQNIIVNEKQNMDYGFLGYDAM